MSSAFDFSGRTVVITGAGQGIGHALAVAFVESGAHVAALDSDPGLLSEAWVTAQQSVTPIVVDVADDEAVQQAVKQVVDLGGGIDALVNNAGITRDAMVWRMPVHDWDAVLAVHLSGTFHLTRAVLPVMREARYGRIVNITSFTGLHGNAGQANYAAAKAGIVGFTKAVAKEVARSGVTVNAVSPNAATPMTAALSPEHLAAFLAAIPVGRLAEAAEIAPAVQFLASEQSGYITGTVLQVDGGLSM